MLLLGLSLPRWPCPLFCVDLILNYWINCIVSTCSHGGTNIYVPKYVGTCAFLLRWVGAWCLLQSFFTLFFETKFFHEPVRLDWVATELLGISYLCPAHTGVIGTCHYDQHFTWALVIRTRVIMFPQKLVYSLSHLSSPILLIFI
jgi:hypothetical protein